MTASEEVDRALQEYREFLRRTEVVWLPVATTCRICGIAGRLFARPRTSAGGHRDREVRCLMCHHTWNEEE